MTFAALMFAVLAFGQNPLPNDPAVKVGKLENGLTYYIRHNDQPAQRAEFWIATDAGAFLEEDHQDGLAHFLEHMCFNGTKNFPGKSLLEWLQSIGAEFGRNINASTGFEHTQYMLNNIPIPRETIIDSCLLILHDYSHFVLAEQDEIDAERGVILEERRTRRNGMWRSFEKSLPYLYNGAPMERRTLIGSEENLKTFKRESLVSFYEKWYQPDNQAIIVVGDIDVDKVEAKIKSTFSDIPAPEVPTVVPDIPVPGNKEPLVGIITDPEVSNTSVEIYWKGEPMPKQYNNTDVAFMTDMIKSFVSIIMYERFNDITSVPGAPFINASVSLGKYCKSVEAVMGNVTCKDGEAPKAFAALMTEIEKMKRYGFTDAEVSRAKENIISRYEKAAEAAPSRKHAEFVRPLLSNFYSNEAYMEPATELELAKAVCSQLNAKILNQVVAQMITDENIVILYNAPEKEGLQHPDAKVFTDILAAVKEADIQANAEESINEPLIDSAKLKGSKSSKVKAGVNNSVQWTMKNGVKVVVLPTDYKKDQVMFQLVQNGGSSLIATEDLNSFESNIWTLWQNNCGLSKFSSTQLSKMLAGKNVSCSPAIGSLTHAITANSTPKDVETALQLMYLTFMEPRFEQDEFQIGIDQINAVLPNIVTQPDFVFQKEFTETVFGNNPRKLTISESVVEKASLETVERVYRDLFKDAAGSILYVVGNVDVDTIKPLIEKYIGSITKGKKARMWQNRGEGIVKGNVVKHFNTKMETPKSSVAQVYSAYVPYSVKDEVLLSAAKYILDMIYTETVREQEGGTYGVGVGCNIVKDPVQRSVIQIMFDTNPESAEKLAALTRSGLEKLANEGPTEEQLSKAIENLKKNIPEKRITNSYWLSVLKKFYEDNIRYDEEYEAAVNSITADGIKAVLKPLLEQGNFIEVIMSPEK